MKILRAIFAVVASFIVFTIAGYLLGYLAIALVVWLLFATVGVYQICKEKKGD